MWQHSQIINRFLPHSKGEHEINFLTKLFQKKPVVEIPPRPSWETVVKMTYDKYLDAFSDDVIFWEIGNSGKWKCSK